MLGPGVHELLSEYTNDPYRMTAELAVDTKTGVITFTKHDFSPVPGSGPAIFGHRFHQRDQKLFVVLDGFGVLRTREINESTNLAPITITCLRPDIVIVLPPNKAYEFAFDVPATMLLVDHNGADDSRPHSFNQQAPTLRAKMNLCAMVECLDGRRVDLPDTDAEFYFPDGRQVRLTTRQSSLTMGGQLSLQFTNETLGVALAEVRNYLGL